MPKRNEPGTGQAMLKAAAMVVIVWGLAISGQVLIPLCFSAVFAVFLSPVVGFLSRRRVPQWVSIVLCAALLFGPLILLGGLLANEANSLARALPNISATVTEQLSRFSNTDLGHKLNLSNAMNPQVLEKQINQGAGSLLTIFGSVLGGVSTVLIVGIFSLIMLASGSQFHRASSWILSERLRLDGEKITTNAFSMVQQFIIARALIVLIIGAADTGILVGFGVNYAPILGAVFGVMTLLPAVGFPIALVPAIIVALTTGHSGGAVLGMTACLFVMSFIEGNVLTPKLAGRRVNLNTFATLVGVFIGGAIWGLWGMLLSVPLLGVIRVVLETRPEYRPWVLLLSQDTDTGAKEKMEHPPSRRAA